MINFFEIYDEGFEVQQANLYKFFAKSFGCKLADAGVSVPEDVRDLLLKEYFKTGLRITIAVSEDNLKLPDELQVSLYKGDLFKIPRGEFEVYIWNENCRWLKIFYWYNHFPLGELGFPWVADSQFVYLGSYSPLEDNYHSKFLIQMVEGEKNLLEALLKSEPPVEEAG
jgi:hypothetical protein